jgi:hypothetical protein
MCVCEHRSCEEWKTRGNSIQVENYYWNGLLSYSTYQLWMHSICPGTTENPPSFCTKLLNEVNQEVGNIDPDNMFTNQCTGNGTLDITATVPDCRSFQDLRDAYLNVCVFACSFLFLFGISGELRVLRVVLHQHGGVLFV